MKTEKLIDGVAKVADVAKTSLDLASSIEQCCDPNIKDKTKSIVGIVGNGIMFGLKIGLFANQNCRENELKLQINSSLSTLSKLIDSQNQFYTEIHNTFCDITQEQFAKIMTDCDLCVKSEFSTDARVLRFWNAITTQSCSPISECDFDYSLSKIQEYDCVRLRQNNSQFSSQYVEQVVIPEYHCFMSQLFGLLKSELKTSRRLI